MQVAGPAAAGADRELTGEMGFAGGGKRRDFLVPGVNPFDLALMAQRVGQPVETVADDAVNALDSRREKNLGELIRYPLCHGSFPFLPPTESPGRPGRRRLKDECSNVLQVQYSRGVGADSPRQQIG